MLGECSVNIFHFHERFSRIFGCSPKRRIQKQNGEPILRNVLGQGNLFLFSEVKLANVHFTSLPAELHPVFNELGELSKKKHERIIRIRIPEKAIVSG